MAKLWTSKTEFKVYCKNKLATIDAPPNSSRDPKVGPQMKQRRKDRIRARSLTHNTLGGGVCYNYGMGLGWTHKREFKMIWTCTIKKRGRLVQVEWKWCGGLNRDNFKHKLHMARNLWEEAPLPSL